MPPTTPAGFVRLAPDGSQLAFVMSGPGRAQLMLANPCGQMSASLAGAPWQVWSVDAATGSERLVGNVDLPAAATGVSGFSLHSDGTRLATSVAIKASDIWMLEGFEQR